MVSSAVDMPKQELVRALARIKKEHSGDPEYEALRKELPKTWPV